MGSAKHTDLEKGVGLPSTVTGPDIGQATNHPTQGVRSTVEPNNIISGAGLESSKLDSKVRDASIEVGAPKQQEEVARGPAQLERAEQPPSAESTAAPAIMETLRLPARRTKVVKNITLLWSPSSVHLLEPLYHHNGLFLRVQLYKHLSVDTDFFHFTDEGKMKKIREDLSY